MTNREHIVSCLQALDTDALLYLKREFGCYHISVEECVKYENCNDCWKHWLESEVKSNDHA